MKKIVLVGILIIILVLGKNIFNNKYTENQEKETNVEIKENINFDEQKYIEVIQNNGYVVNYNPEKKPDNENIKIYHVATKDDINIIYEEIETEQTKAEVEYDGNDENIISMINEAAEEEKKQNEVLVNMYYENAKNDCQKNAIKKVEDEEFGENWKKYTFETSDTYACVLNLNNIIIIFKDNYINSNEEMKSIKKEFENIINSFYE